MENEKPTQESWTPGRCNETSGFLFRHECGEMPMRQCQLCGKPLCEKHAYETVDGSMCTTCFKKQNQDLPGNRMHDDDPNFYGDRYYRGYGHFGQGYWGYAWLGPHGTHHHHRRHHDPQDFTEADAESLNMMGDEDFESDMTES